MKKIKIISLGGTISAKGYDRLDLKDYRSGLLTGDEIINSIPEANELAHIDIEQLDNVTSTAINSSHWTRLRDSIHIYLHEENYDGIVITHGTNTLEETAYFLHLTVDSEKPIVLTGAQRPFSAMSSDVHFNLLNAIRVAVDQQSHGKGVLVVLNDTISSAREVTKTSTYRVEAFQAPQLGFSGFIEPDNTIQYYRSPVRKHTTASRFAKFSLNQLPDIEIIYSYAGATGELIRHIITSGKYHGIVMAGTGAGRFSPLEDEALLEAVEKGLIVVRSSRVGSGRVVDIEHYQAMNAVTADNLTPQKARILLMLSLLQTNDVHEIQQCFNEY